MFTFLVLAILAAIIIILTVGMIVMAARGEWDEDQHG